ncbi:hypothetical protein NPIL_644921 [Nephila pilipes]|uniref:Uncharacterized protein n=1 Tax=Nephila pilipes TaxID=299642 RepID=A0A8X6NB45_NEPPI|nr:hypothetical protein NPIL_644921 [Nephila pilipes]
MWKNTRSKAMDYFDVFDEEEESYLVKFYKNAARELNWGELFGETVLFLGRGDGNDSYRLLETFPNIRKIRDFNCLRQLPRNEYDVCKIRHFRTDLVNSKPILKYGGATKILCVICLTFIHHKREALRKIYSTLTNGGSAAFIFFVESSYVYILERIHELQYEKKKIPQIPFCVDEPNATFYRDLLINVGFLVKACRRFDFVKTFSSAQECKGSETSEYDITSDEEDSDCNYSLKDALLWV